jgi:TonB-dependent starch-binding outer membrane protein SusC
MGSPWPKATYGLQINADYKWFDLAISGAGVYKRDVFNAGKVRTDQFASYDYSTSTTALTRWTPDQPSTTNYRITGNDPNKNMANPSSWYIEDGSFFRLKNISLGFTLPKEWTQKIKINRLRIYGSAQNLFTVTKYTGFDPEFGIGGATGAGVDNGSYPQSKVMLFGIQLDI